MIHPITKKLLNKVISGTIKDTIRCHGDITPLTISSFSKRLTGELIAILNRAGVETLDLTIIKQDRDVISYEKEIANLENIIEQLHKQLIGNPSAIKQIKIFKKIKVLKRKIRFSELSIAFGNM